MKIKIVKRETCGCEAYPFCEHAPNAVKEEATRRDEQEFGKCICDQAEYQSNTCPRHGKFVAL